MFQHLGHILPGLPYPYRGSATDCPLCGSASHAPIARWDRRLKRLTTRLCGACGLFFTDPMPTEAELAAFYARLYRFSYQGAFGGLSARHGRRKAAEARFRLGVLERVAGPLRGRRALEVGAGGGELVAALADAGARSEGLEPGGGGRDPRIARGTVAEADYPAEAFDLIVCLHVLEHLRAPMPALDRLRRWLAPGGVLYLEVPNMQHYEPKGTLRFHFAHVLGFSGDNLKWAAAMAGFACLSEEQETSLVLVRDDDPRGRAMPVDLAGTVKANRASYGAALAPGARLVYEVGRIARLRRRARIK